MSIALKVELDEELTARQLALLEAAEEDLQVRLESEEFAMLLPNLIGDFKTIFDMPYTHPKYIVDVLPKSPYSV